MGTEGVVLTYLNKKLEVYPLFSGKNDALVSLKYRYSLRDGKQWNLRIENFIVKDQTFTKSTGDVCGEDLFSYAFQSNKGALVIHRNQKVGEKSETYTRNIAQIPNYYRTRP